MLKKTFLGLPYGFQLSISESMNIFKTVFPMLYTHLTDEPMAAMKANPSQDDTPICKKDTTVGFMP